MWIIVGITFITPIYIAIVLAVVKETKFEPKDQCPMYEVFEMIGESKTSLAKYL